jgi:hypothetical protein
MMEGRVSKVNDMAHLVPRPATNSRPPPRTLRPLYGAVRSMARSGMERKTKVAAYLEEIEHLEQTGEEPSE